MGVVISLAILQILRKVCILNQPLQSGPLYWAQDPDYQRLTDDFHNDIQAAFQIVSRNKFSILNSSPKTFLLLVLFLTHLMM